MPSMIRCVMISTGIAMTVVSLPAMAEQRLWNDETVMADSVLSQVVGKAGPTTRLSVMVDEQGAVLGQILASNIRSNFDNWFADNNVQRISNL